MLEEEGAVIVGLLVGLNVIDANLCVKGEDLDSQVTSVLRPLDQNNTADLNTLFQCVYLMMWLLYSMFAADIRSTSQ